jgi:hypothetical protein
MVNKNERLSQLIQKHKPLNKKELLENFQEQKKIRQSFTTDAVELEKNLMNFNKIIDPMINPDEPDNALCWIRRPTTAQLEKMLPAELMAYKNDPNAIPVDIMKKNENFQFEMMAELIELPKHNAQWWKENSNLVFQSLFQKHLTGVLEDLGINAENF